MHTSDAISSRNGDLQKPKHKALQKHQVFKQLGTFRDRSFRDLFMEPHISNVKSSGRSNKKWNTIPFLDAVTCVAWPCCCSCCSCCAVRKLTGLFPAMSFVPAGIVVRMIFLPNPLMLQKENCGKVSEQQARSFTLRNGSSVARRLKLLI